MKTYVFSKTSSEVSLFKLQALPFEAKEIELISISPIIQSNPISVEYTASPEVALKVSGGQVNTTYTILLKIISFEGIHEIFQIAIVVSDSEFDPIVTSAPDAFMDLVGSMKSGESTVSTVVFNIPSSVENANTGYILWELINNNSEVLSEGNAFSYDVSTNGIDNVVSGQCVIVCPSYLEPTTIGRRYQIRYTLVIDSQEYYQYETLTINPKISVPLGATDVVEMVGKKTTLSLVVPNLYASCSVTIYKGNNAITSACQVTNPERVSSGWLYNVVLNTKDFVVSLDNYNVSWEVTNDGEVSDTISAKLWIINPSINDACQDILAKVQKARATLYGAPDLIYTMPTLLTWLRRGRDLFNAWQGLFTNFTMTNAKGAIREYWLLCSELGALEAQYLAEGEKAFDFGGAAISLNVDRTGFLESMASNIRSNLDSNLKPIKQNMIQKGVTAGDGSGSDGEGGIASSMKSLGTVGISITPASFWGRFYSPYLIGTAWK